MIGIQVSQREIDLVIEQLGATEKDIKKALRSTVSKMSGWLRTRAARAMSQELALKNAAVRKRLKSLRFKMTGDVASGGLWIGQNPIDLLHIGGAMQDDAGVQSRNQRFKGAFMGPRPGVSSLKLRGRAFVRIGQRRLPIEKVGLDVKDQIDKALESRVMEYGKFEAQFMKTFERELKWRTQKQT